MSDSSRTDVVLGASLDAGALDTVDRFLDKNARKIGIGTEALPVAATEGRPPQGSYDWPIVMSVLLACLSSSD